MDRNVKAMAGKLVVSGALTLAALGLASGTAHAFDPQPDPPGKPVASNPATNPGTIKGFNPQPEPPTKVRIGAQTQR
ncbi:MAG: hypothetical protein QOH60_2587 [Mycobacterium sp.]|jgi:hypothetical protein|nr:hypothetical protein [Mycobacterium sp.]